MSGMVAMQVGAPGKALVRIERPLPGPDTGELLIEVAACGVCRTDLHVLDGEISARYPVIPGHEIVGRVAAIGPAVRGFTLGQRVGVPWLGHTCGACPYCRAGRENLCDAPLFTGATLDGGYASHVVADAHYCFGLPERFSDVEAVIGLYGFGAPAHILAQVARHQRRTVYAFTKDGDKEGQDFARSLGCAWAGGSSDDPPQLLDAALIFAPVGELVPRALQAVRKGGRVICAGIHMSDIPSFPYADLWEE